MCSCVVFLLSFVSLFFACSVSFLKVFVFFFHNNFFLFFQQFLSIVMPNSVNARCFPCKNTLRPSVVHNLTKISSFDQKMWAKETNRFFFNQSFIFFHFHQCFFLRGQGGFFLFFSFLTFTLFFVVCFSFFLCTIWGEKMNEYNSILCIPVRFFSTHSLQKRSSRLTP